MSQGIWTMTDMAQMTKPEYELKRQKAALKMPQKAWLFDLHSSLHSFMKWKQPAHL